MDFFTPQTLGCTSLSLTNKEPYDLLCVLCLCYVKVKDELQGFYMSKSIP